MQYPVVIQRTGDSEYRVIVPDIPGCYSTGYSMENALQSAAETIELHLDSLTQQGNPIPSPRRLEDHQANNNYRDGLWALVTVDVSKHLGKSKRINITMPERLLIQIDKFTAQNGGNRSGFLADAALNYISRRHYQAEQAQRDADSSVKPRDDVRS